VDEHGHRDGEGRRRIAAPYKSEEGFIVRKPLDAAKYLGAE